MRVGSLRAASSVVIIPDIATHISAAPLQCVPGDLLPRADDSAETLAARVGASPFLDDAHVLNKGNGKRGRNGQWAFEKHFPTWSKMRDDMGEDYHEFVSEHINVTDELEPTADAHGLPSHDELEAIADGILQ